MAKIVKKCRRTQLREVINGNRKSKRLMARLRDAGIKVEVAGW